MTDKNNVRRGRNIVFADGEERWIKPLTITRLRKFVVLLDDMDENGGMNDAEFDKMLDASALILEKDYGHLVKRDDEGKITNYDELGEVVDMPSFNEMMAIAMGQSDPNALPLMMEG